MAERNSESQKSLETLSAELKEQLAASVPWRGLAVVWRNPKHRAISAISQNKANWEDFFEWVYQVYLISMISIIK